MASSFHNRIFTALLLAGCFVVCGCRNLGVGDQASSGIKLPAARMESDSVALRVAVAELDHDQKSQFRQFMRTTDVLQLPLSVRKVLDQNGFRVGVVSTVDSSLLQGLLAPRNVETEIPDEARAELAAAGKLAPTPRLKSHRHVERKRGDSFHIVVSPVMNSARWTLFDEETHVSDHVPMAQCKIRVSSWPEVDGSVRMEFLPEIHFGRSQSRIGVSGDDLAMQEQQQIKPLYPLAFSLSLRVGETVVLAPTAELERLGSLFFGPSDDSDPNERSSGSSLEDVDQNEIALGEFFPMLKSDRSDSASGARGGQSAFRQSDSRDSATGKMHSGGVWQRFALIQLVKVTERANAY